MYTVGQIIYVYKGKKEAVFPCVVSEEVTKKTLKGQEKTYSIILPDDDFTEIELSKLDVTSFNTLKEFRDRYMQDASRKVDAIIKQCKSIEQTKLAQYKSNTGQNEQSHKTDLLDNVKIDSSVNSKSQGRKTNKTVEAIDSNGVKLNIDLSSLDKLEKMNNVT